MVLCDYKVELYLFIELHLLPFKVAIISLNSFVLVRIYSSNLCFIDLLLFRMTLLKTRKESERMGDEIQALFSIF